MAKCTKRAAVAPDLYALSVAFAPDTTLTVEAGKLPAMRRTSASAPGSGDRDRSNRPDRSCRLSGSSWVTGAEAELVAVGFAIQRRRIKTQEARTRIADLELMARCQGGCVKPGHAGQVTELAGVVAAAWLQPHAERNGVVVGLIVEATEES